MNAVIELGGRLTALSSAVRKKQILRIAVGASDSSARDREGFLVAPGATELPSGYGAYFFAGDFDGACPENAYRLPASLNHLAAGDVVRLEPERAQLRVLFRSNSPSNSFLVTERCDNFCIMCSQPPKARDDSWIVDELLQVIPLLPKETASVGITGGEPGLLGERLLDVVRAFASYLPSTHLHVLSNGRAFRDEPFARALSEAEHPSLTLGIPLYSAVSNDHDFVVQARGAYDETLKGILNLKRHRVGVEVRFVIHRQTVEGLEEFASFVARNLVFVDHVALMGLELMGFARANLEALWIDPIDYCDQLRRAVDTLRAARVPTSIYNHQLCTLPRELWPLARRSISDWKNDFSKECDGCSARTNCGGFFVSSSLRRSRGIRALTEVES